jgi:hypothetical protein
MRRTTMDIIHTDKTELGVGKLHVYRRKGDNFPSYKLNGPAQYGPEDEAAEDWEISGTFTEVLETYEHNGCTVRKWRVVDQDNQLVCSGEW